MQDPSERFESMNRGRKAYDEDGKYISVGSMQEDAILKLPVIPAHVVKKMNIGGIKPGQRKKIAILLGIPYKKTSSPIASSFPRCRAKKKRFVKECEEKGDFSHSPKEHVCDECRCKRVAGWGTKGDFYGWGPETGHYGVGYCASHEKSYNVRNALEVAKAHFNCILKARDSQETVTDFELVANEKGEIAEHKKAVRADIALVESTLDEFKDELKKKSLTEYAKGELGPLSDATRIRLQLDVAKTISRLDLNAFKLDQLSYIHYDELAIRIPRMINLAKQKFQRLRELVMSEDNKDDPVEIVTAEWIRGLKDIWNDTKTGIKK